MKAYVINLDRSPDRWAFAEAQAARIGLDLVRVPATDGARIPPEERARLCPPPSRITASELACYLSHVQAWRAIAAGPDSHGAVFEDDILLARDTGAFLSTSEWLPPDADLVKLNATRRPIRLLRTGQPALNGRNLHRLVTPTIDAAAYVISAAHARHLVATTERYLHAVDNVLFDPASGASVYQLNPGIAVQQKFSQIDFLPASCRPSQVQAHRIRPPFNLAEDVSLTKLRKEVRNLYRKEIFPRVFPALNLLLPPERRLNYIVIPFSPGPTP